MSDISPSAIKVDAALEEKLKGATFEEIKRHLADASVEQGLCTRDNDPNILNPNLAGPVPKRFATTVTDPKSGQKVIFEGESELDVTRQSNNFLQERITQSAATTPVEPQPRDADTGQFVSAADAELELKFQRGEITTAQYLTESKAVEKHLEAQGISTDALREVSGKVFEQSWATAAETFKSRHSEWIGGDANRDILGKIISDNNLMDMNPIEALELAYTHAKDNGLLVPNEEVERINRIASAKTRAELDEALQLPERQRTLTQMQASGLFGRR